MRRAKDRDLALALMLFVLLRGRFGGGSGPFSRWPGNERARPRRYPPFSAPPGNDNDNLGTMPLPPNPLGMPEAEPGVITTPHWPTTTPG